MRHHLTKNAVTQAHGLIAHWGYVDDTATLLLCTEAQANNFVSQLNASLEPMKWEHSIEASNMNFLDLRLQLYIDSRGGVQIWTTLFCHEVCPLHTCR